MQNFTAPPQCLNGLTEETSRKISATPVDSWHTNCVPQERLLN
jgi:hypothetical protein